MSRAVNSTVPRGAAGGVLASGVFSAGGVAGAGFTARGPFWAATIAGLREKRVEFEAGFEGDLQDQAQLAERLFVELPRRSQQESENIGHREQVLFGVGGAWALADLGQRLLDLEGVGAFRHQLLQQIGLDVHPPDRARLQRRQHLLIEGGGLVRFELRHKGLHLRPIPQRDVALQLGQLALECGILGRLALGFFGFLGFLLFFGLFGLFRGRGGCGLRPAGLCRRSWLRLGGSGTLRDDGRRRRFFCGRSGWLGLRSGFARRGLLPSF